MWRWKGLSLKMNGSSRLSTSLHRNSADVMKPTFARGFRSPRWTGFVFVGKAMCVSALVAQLIEQVSGVQDIPDNLSPAVAAVAKVFVANMVEESTWYV